MDVLTRQLDADPLLQEAVTFTGPLPAEKLRAVLRNASGLLHVSAHEGFGLPLLEAMLAGIPVFAVPEVAVPETLGNAGIIIDADEPDEAAKRILNLLNDHNVRGEVVAAQARQAEQWLDAAKPDLLLEYLSFGIVPILDSKYIGDFKKFGMRYVDAADLERGIFLSPKQHKTYTRHNFAALKALQKRTESNMLRLKKSLAE